MSRNFGMSVIRTEDSKEWLIEFSYLAKEPNLLGPLGPRVIPSSLCGWFREQLKVGDTTRTMPHGRSDTIITGVTPSNDNYVLAPGVYEIPVLKLGVHQGRCIQLEVLHCKMDALGTSIRDLEVSRPSRPCGKNQCVVLCSNLFNVNIHTNVGIGYKNLFQVSTTIQKAPFDIPLLRRP